MIVGLFALSALFSTSVYDRFVAERQIAEKERTAARELDTLKQKAAVLEAQVQRLESDRGKEAEIRDRYEVSKKGEQVVVVVDTAAVQGGDEDATVATETPSVEESETPSFWHFW